ncbi:MAG: Rpn family recombination-promoting nuclease/putative transposase [Zoogloeaceae bacterium]|nr:Rpn family recombination-promoting nuclease/putative transposase [Zoogloeaceae bacterium]
MIDPHLLGEYPEDKLGVLDVKAIPAQGNAVDMEIQLNPAPEMRGRALFYLSGMLREQVMPERRPE